MTILVIEDDKKLLDTLQRALKREKYAVDVASDGVSGLGKAMKNKYGLILLNLGLPKKDGLSVCRELRAREIQTPIIMLTTRGAVFDRVAGLDAGADDYIVKPCVIEELLARIRAVMRRRKTSDSNIFKIGNLIMDKRKHEVTRAGKHIKLTPKEYRLLDTLLTHHGEALSRRELLDNIWGPDFKETHNELNVHIRYLRKKVDGNSKKLLIHTIRGVGFVLKE